MMQGYAAVLFLMLASMFVKEASSINCYQNWTPGNNITKNNDKGSKTDCGSANYCVKISGEGYNLRFCDIAIAGATFCPNGAKCDTSSCNPVGTFAKLPNPQQLDTSCSLCCCDKDDCNFAIGTKAFGVFVIVGVIFSFITRL